MHDQCTNDDTMPRFLTVAEVTQQVGLGESTVWERSRRGTFPKPVKLAPRTTRWVAAEVADWMRAAMAQRA